MKYVSAILIITSMITCEASAQNRNTKEPILLHADNLQIDPQTEHVVASGHVEVIQEHEVLTADKLTYDRATDKITATGNVVLHRSSGDVIFAPYVELQNEMKDGVIKEMRTLFIDDSRLAANNGVREGGVKTQMDQAVYSPCKVCKENPNKPPLWQFKSESALWDEEAHDIIYSDAHMEFFGVPVFYSPYFRHPDPTVKQRSGILTPEFNHNSDLGFVVAVPYYQVISADKDMTIRPIYTSERGSFLDLEYRQRFSNADLRLGGSFGESKKLKRKVVGNTRQIKREQEKRGHIDSTLEWHLTDNWRIRGHALRATDRTYLRQFPFYGYTAENVLRSHAEAEGFYGLNYIHAQGILYQGLRDIDRQKRIPKVGPLIDVNYVSPSQFWGSRFYVNANSLFIQRQEGTDMKRVSTDATWSLPYTSRWGDHYVLSLKARGDVYHYDDFRRPGQRNISKGTQSRFFPQMVLEYDYPWVRQIKNGAITLSPEASVILAPNVGSQANIPNEDSFILEPTDMNLLNYSRFPGLDRIDEGCRVNYGLKARGRYATDYRGEMFFGQSANVSKHSDNFRNTGFEKRWSDYVGRIGVKVTDYFKARYRFRMDRASYRLVRNEVLTQFGVPILTFSVDYLQLPRFIGEQSGQGGKQAVFGISSAFHPGWTAAVSTTRELAKKKQTLSQTASLIYENECLKAMINATRSFYVDQDLKPSKTLLFVLAFKTSTGQEIGALRLNKQFDEVTTPDGKEKKSPFKSIF